MSLLAVRLEVGLEDLPVLSFEILTRTALSGHAYTSMIGPVLHLNRLRNIVAHELEPTDANALMAEFVATMPSSMSDAMNRPRDMPITEVFVAALMVVIYALLELRKATTDTQKAP